MITFLIVTLCAAAVGGYQIAGLSPQSLSTPKRRDAKMLDQDAMSGDCRASRKMCAQSVSHSFRSSGVRIDTASRIGVAFVVPQN